MLPILVNGLQENFEESPKSTATLFNLLLKLLHSMTWPARGSKDDVDLRVDLGFDENAQDARFVATRLGKLFLFTAGPLNVERLPGLNKQEVDFFKLYGKEDTWDVSTKGGLNTTGTKLLASKFLASGAFLDSERYIPAVLMTANMNSRISDTGEDILKRASNDVFLEDPFAIGELYRIYLGTRGQEGSLPARPILQTKILTLLTRSKLIPSFINKSVQIIDEALASNTGEPSDGTLLNQHHGLEASKLRQKVFAFANWLARICPPAEVSSFAPNLVSRFQEYVESQGWPRPRQDPPLDSGELHSRGFVYESIGLFAAASPQKLLEDPNLHLLRWLLTSLSEDPSGKEISISIEQGLSSVLVALSKHIQPELEQPLTSLLSHHMSLVPTVEDLSEGVVRSTKFVAVRFANRCLPYHNVDARWIDVLAMCGDANERNEVIEEGRRGLEPYWYKILNPPSVFEGTGVDESHYTLPNFVDLVSRFFGADSGWDSMKIDRPSYANAYIIGLTFCRNILFNQLSQTKKASWSYERDWEHRVDSMILNDEAARATVHQHLGRRLDDPAFLYSLRRYLMACLNGLIYSHVKDSGRPADHFLDICSLSPSNLYTGLLNDVTVLKKPLGTAEPNAQEKAAHVFGFLSSLDPNPVSPAGKMVGSFLNEIKSWRSAIGADILRLRGALLAVGYFLSRSKNREHLPPHFFAIRDEFIALVFSIVSETRDKSLVNAALAAVSELLLFGVLGPETISDPDTLTKFASKLNEYCKDGNEEAVAVTGFLAMQYTEEDREDSGLNKTVAGLFNLHTVRQAEIQFAVGAALACASCGWQSKSLVSANDIDGSRPTSKERDKTLSSVLDKVLKNCATTKPSLRQASAIWLLCILQYCGHLEEVQSRLRDSQNAFKGLLSDRDSLNQESASRGLTLVYQRGNRSLKDDLIKDLVGSFTGTKSGLAGSVSADTELFDSGALPTGEGSITTYKDIMSLASEVGDTSLVYRFMSLASNNAIWSSRAAVGRFGLSDVLSEASAEGYLAKNPKLYSALFRYRFDPNTNVRTAMNDIWTALVKEPTATINTYFQSILQDLLKTMLGKEWRVRQASCAALADLLQGRPLEMYESYLTEIWTTTFKVCDDIKESVRGAAMALARVLTGILTREMDGGQGASRNLDRMLTQVLPFLLSPSGLESGAPDVQEFSRKALLEIIRKADGKMLRPFVPELIGRLLALLSSIEPEMINYLHLNADKYGITTDQIDEARLQHVKGSSLLEAIERCLDFLDESCMPEFKTQLENAIKTVIGLPSKVGCSRVLVSLSTRRAFIFRPYADSFLQLARKQVFDRNDTVSSSYAVACGYIARSASDAALLRLIESCRSLYFSTDEDRQRAISGEIVYAISKHATDRFNALGASVLPFVFIAKYDTDEKVRKPFEMTWSENVGGSRTVLLYMSEILQFTSEHLDSPKWSVKHTSALAVAEAINAAGNNISDDTARKIWPVLEQALAGKTWDGKEKVLKAFVTFSKNSNLLNSDKEIQRSMEKMMTRESKRNNSAYRMEAFESLGSFMKLLHDTDHFDDVFGIVGPVVENLASASPDEMDVDAGSGRPSTKAVAEGTISNAIKALLMSINPDVRIEDHLGVALSRAAELIQIANRSQHASGRMRVGIYQGLEDLFLRIKDSNEGKTPGCSPVFLTQYSQFVLAASGDAEQNRVAAAEATRGLSYLVLECDKSLRDEFLNGLEKAIGQERSIAIKRILDEAKAVMQGSS